MKASDTKKPYEKAWMNRVEIAREWVEYKDDQAYPSLIKDNPGYIREARRGLNWDSFDDRYQWPIIDADKYQHFYRDVFYHKQHNNYVSMDQHEGAVGPIIWSIESKKGSSTERDRDLKVLVQSKKGVERVTIARHVIEETGGVVPAFKQTLPAYNKLQFTKLSTQLIKDRLLKYEDQIVRTVYKFGVLYCKEGQTEEDEMYNNRHGSPAFDRFLDFLGDRVKLEGFTGYRGGLDVKTNTTGTHSVHTTHIDDCEIMFHVSTLLQYFPADPQQVERKRHLGNDVVLIIFRDKGDNVPFNPKVIRSQFNHIFAVFEEDPELSTAKAPVYRIEIGCKDGVMPFGPDLPNPPLLTTSPKCRRWLLSKLINSERAAYYAPDFLMKFRNTRKAQLQAIIEEALSAAPKKSLSLGRKTGSSILKGASKMMTVRRSKDAFNPDSFQISKPFDYRHEAHLDNSGSDGASFGALLTDGSFLDLMKSDEAAGILPICTDGGKRLTKATSFDDKMASQLIPRSARPPLSSSPSETSSTLKLSSTRKSAIHAPPAKPLPPPGGSTPSEGRKGSREGSSPAKKEEERTAIYGLSPISLSGSRPLDEDNRDDDSASASGWVVGTFHTGDEPEPKRERHHQAPPPKPGGVGAVPHKPKRATDVAFERPNKPPPPPPGGSDAKPQASRRRRPVDTEKRRPPPSVDDGARKSHSGSSSSEPNGSESLSSSGSGSSSRRRSGSTSTKDDDTTHRSGDTPEEKRRSRPPSSPRGERGEDRIGRRRTMGTASGSPRSRASVQGAFDSPSPSPKPGRRSGSSPRHNGSSQQAD